jgi:antitoxin ParD1/3/4
MADYGLRPNPPYSAEAAAAMVRLALVVLFATYSSMTKPKIEKISVAITAEQHTKIRAAVERGDYATTSEVIRAALREWELKMRRLEGERIAKLWDEGLASGPARERPIDDIIDEAKGRLAKGQAAE